MEKRQPSEKQINFAKVLGIDNPGQYDMTTLSGMIEAKKKTEPTKEEVDASYATPAPKAESSFEKAMGMGRDHKYDKDPVGLAVEIYNTMYNTDTQDNAVGIMNTAIDLVKKAQEAFI